MKKNIFIILVMTCGLLFSGCFFYEGIYSEKKIEARNIENILTSGREVSEVLSREEALENIDTLCYLLATSYAGYEDCVARGLDVELLKACLDEQVMQLDTIETNDLVDLMAEELKPYINDIHLCLQGSGEKLVRLTGHKNIFFSDVYVAGNGSDFVVVKTDSMSLEGKVYGGSSENLFAYCTEIPDTYRIGVMSEETVDSIEVELDGTKTNLSVKLVQSIDPVYDVTEKEFETGDSVYIRVTSFSMPYADSSERAKADECMYNYMLAGKKYIGKKNIVLDLRGNPGGDDSYSTTFLYNLLRNTGNTSSAMGVSFAQKLYPTEAYSLMYYSPASAKYLVDSVIKSGGNESSLKYYSSLYEKSVKKQSQLVVKSSHKAEELKNQFGGQLYIIMDGNVASSGESTIQYAQYFFGPSRQVTLVGTNTMGCMSYGNICAYKLSSKGIIFRCGMADFKPMFTGITSFAGEGIGFAPDYWCTTEDLAATLASLTGDDEIIRCFE